MNKSIMKTRNQLERITQKINQLKNKYSCQNLEDTNTNTNINTNTLASFQQSFNKNLNISQPSTPKNHILSKNSSRKSIPKQDDHFKNVLSTSQTQNISNINYNKLQNQQNFLNANSYTNCNIPFEQLYRKEFKIFRNQLYQYLDHQLARMKNRQNQLQVQITQLSQQSQQNKLLYEQFSVHDKKIDKIQKIQEIFHNLESTVQNLSLQVKKNDTQYQKKFKKLYHKVNQVNSQQSQNILNKVIPDLKKEIIFEMKALLIKQESQKDEQRQNILKCVSQKLRYLQQTQNCFDKTISKMQNDFQKLKNQIVQMKVFNQKNDQLLQEAIKQIQQNKVQTLKEVKQIQRKISQQVIQKQSNSQIDFQNLFKAVQQKVLQSQKIISKSLNKLWKTQIDSLTQKLQQKYSVLQSQIKFTRQSILQDIQFRIHQKDTQIQSILKDIDELRSTNQNLNENQIKPNLISEEELLKQKQEISLFNKQICNQIQMINESYGKLQSKCLVLEQKINQNVLNIQEKINQCVKKVNNNSQKIQKVQKVSKQAKNQYQILQKQINKLKDIEKIEELQNKFRQIDSTFAKKQQLSKIISIIQTFNFKTQEIQEKAISNSNQFIKETQFIKKEISQLKQQFQKERQCNHQKQSINKNEEDSFQNHLSNLKEEIVQILSQQVIKTDQKLNILNENILQSAQQFKDYIEESQQCYNQMHSTIKILSSNLQKITQNQEYADQTCRKLIGKLQQKFDKKIKQIFFKLNTNNHHQIEALNSSLSSSQLKQIRQKVQLLNIEISKNNEKLIQLQTKSKIKKIQQQKEYKNIQVQAVSIEIPPNVQMFVNLIEESIKNMKNNILKEINSQSKISQSLNYNSQSQIIFDFEQLKKQFDQVKNKSEILSSNYQINYQNIIIKIEQIQSKTNHLQKLLSIKQTEKIQHNLGYLSLNNSRRLKQSQFVSFQKDRLKSLQEQLSFIKRTFIQGSQGFKQQSVLRKIRIQFQQFKEKQQQQQSRLKTIVSNEVYKNMANQFTKMSEILQKTFEELQQKHAKLEYHLNYFNERITALQNGNKVTHSQAKDSIHFSSLSILEKLNYQSPSKMLSTISANRFDANSRISQNINEDA